MKRYLDLVNEKNKLKYDIKEEVERLHIEFIKDHKLHLRILDICIALVILFNLGAVLITNAMVLKEEPEAEFAEFAVVAAKAGDYELHQDSPKLYNLFMLKSFTWILIIGMYLYSRKVMFTNSGLKFLTAYVLIISVVVSYDFISNLGFFIGKELWGKIT